MDTSEKNFESSIEASLLRDPLSSGSKDVAALGDAATGPYLSGGYRRRESADYNKELCLIPKDVLDFIYATQPKEWDKMQKQHGADAKPMLLKRLASEIQKHGTLHVLRKGIKANGCKFRLVYFRPSSGLNESARKLYLANQFTIVRQLKFSQKNEKSLDMAIFLNGLPLFTGELKNPFKGQSVQDAVKQYRLDRDPKEPLSQIIKELNERFGTDFTEDDKLFIKPGSEANDNESGEVTFETFIRQALNRRVSFLQNPDLVMRRGGAKMGRVPGRRREGCGQRASCGGTGRCGCALRGFQEAGGQWGRLRNS